MGLENQAVGRVSNPHQGVVPTPLFSKIISTLLFNYLQPSLCRKVKLKAYK